MALISCKECGKEVSSTAKACPNCGASIQNQTNNIIRIKIGQHPISPGYPVVIKNAVTKEKIAEGKSGGVIEFKSQWQIMITFHSAIGPAMLTATVSPANGGKYEAVWGQGIFMPRITSCSKIDNIVS
jgi:predicted amidophosphoribosyltransferase